MPLDWAAQDVANALGGSLMYAAMPQAENGKRASLTLRTGRPEAPSDPPSHKLEESLKIYGGNLSCVN